MLFIGFIGLSLVLLLILNRQAEASRADAIWAGIRNGAAGEFRFSVETTALANGVRHRRLLSAERDAIVEYISSQGHGVEPRTNLELQWLGWRIPFDIYRSESVDPATGETYYLSRLGGLGRALWGTFDRSRFPAVPDDEERAIARRLLIEAALVFGGHFDGLERPDGYNRVLVDGVELRLSDVGYL